MSNPEKRELQQPSSVGENVLGEQLVAYLDGELSASESESIERSIHNDDSVKSELQQYDRVWNALDDLPRATVDDSFARTTIEMATVQARQELAEQTAMLPVRKRNTRTKLAGLVVVATLLGFIAFSAVLPNPNRTLYANLPLISQLDAYLEVQDVEFLRRLNQECGDWLLGDYGEAANADAAMLATLTSANYGERRRHVLQLDEDEAADLADKAKRYSRLSPPMRDEVATREVEITTAPDADTLRKTMLAYYAWAVDLPEGEQAALRQLDTEARVASVVELQRRLSRQDANQLSPAEVAALRKVYKAAAEDAELLRLRQELLDIMPKVEGFTPGMRREERFRIVLVMQFMRSKPRESIGMALLASGGRHDALKRPQFVAYVTAIESYLMDAFDESTTQRLRSMPQHERSRLLAKWLRETRSRKRPDLATLEEYFVSGSLPADEQQKLLSMPRDEMLRSLERRYRREMMGDAGLNRLDHLERRGREVDEFDRRGPPPRPGGPGEGPPEGRGPRGRRFDRPTP